MKRGLVVVAMVMMAGGWAWAAGTKAAPAPKQPPRWIEDVDAGLTQAKFSGRATVLLFWTNWCGYCEAMENLFLANATSAVAKRAVLVMVDVNPPRREVAAKYKVEGHHVLVVVGWDGKELGRVGWNDDAKKTYERVLEAVAVNDAGAAKKLLEAGRFENAAERASRTLEVVKEGPAAETAAAVMEAVKVKTQEELATAEKLLEEGRLGDCEELCKQLAEAYPAEMVRAKVKELRKRSKEAAKGRPAAPAATSAGPKQKAQDLVDQGMVLEWEGKYLEAVRRYERAVKEFPNEKTTGEAKGRLESLRKDEKVAVMIKQQEIDEECQRILERARAWAQNGRVAEAKAEYEKLIEKYAGTEWARTAAEEMKGL